MPKFSKKNQSNTITDLITVQKWLQFVEMIFRILTSNSKKHFMAPKFYTKNTIQKRTMIC